LDDDEIGTLLIGSAIQIHRVLGPGLLESVYETCLHHELIKAGLEARRQVFLPIEYDGLQFDNAFRTDILVEDKLIVEIKVVERIQPIHLSQLMTYLRLSRRRVGYIFNFNVTQLRQGGIKRLVNG
jgi:GxxExxY protein